MNFNSPKAACRRSTRSTRPHRTRRCFYCICTTRRCLIVRRFACWDSTATLRTRPAGLSLVTPKAGQEAAGFKRWLGMTRPGEGSDSLRVNGAGENLVWSAADFENFLQPRPELRPVMEQELEAIVRNLAEARWPWRIHATYDESI